MEKDNLDKIFKAQSDGFNEMPSSRVWESIENNLDNSEENSDEEKIFPIKSERKIEWKWIAAAASVLLFAVSALLFLNNNNETNVAVAKTAKEEILKPENTSSEIAQSTDLEEVIENNESDNLNKIFSWESENNFKNSNENLEKNSLQNEKNIVNDNAAVSKKPKNIPLKNSPKKSFVRETAIDIETRNDAPAPAETSSEKVDEELIIGRNEAKDESYFEEIIEDEAPLELEEIVIDNEYVEEDFIENEDAELPQQTEKTLSENENTVTATETSPYTYEVKIETDEIAIAADKNEELESKTTIDISIPSRRKNKSKEPVLNNNEYLPTKIAWLLGAWQLKTDLKKTAKLGIAENQLFLNLEFVQIASTLNLLLKGNENETLQINTIDDRIIEFSTEDFSKKVTVYRLSSSKISLTFNNINALPNDVKLVYTK